MTSEAYRVVLRPGDDQEREMRSIIWGQLVQALHGTYTQANQLGASLIPLGLQVCLVTVQTPCWT